MENTLMPNPFRKALRMAQIEPDRQMSFSLSAKNKERAWLALPCFRPCVGAPVALQQSRILRTSMLSLAYIIATLRKGDISTLSNRGHFYFGLTFFRQGLLAQSSRVPFNQS